MRVTVSTDGTVHWWRCEACGDSAETWQTSAEAVAGAMTHRCPSHDPDACGSGKIAECTCLCVTCQAARR